LRKARDLTLTFINNKFKISNVQTNHNKKKQKKNKTRSSITKLFKYYINGKTMH